MLATKAQAQGMACLLKGGSLWSLVGSCVKSGGTQRGGGKSCAEAFVRPETMKRHADQTPSHWQQMKQCNTESGH